MPKKKNVTIGSNTKSAQARRPPRRSGRGPSNNTDGVPFSLPHGISLAEEARNTASNRRGMRGHDARLRYQPVTFMSAGLMNPLDGLNLPRQTMPLASNALVPDVHDDNGSFCALAPEADVQIEPAAPTHLSPEHEEPGAASDSSDEVILFKGRNPPQPRAGSPGPKTQVDNNIENHKPMQPGIITNLEAHATKVKVERKEAELVQSEESFGCKAKRSTHGRRQVTCDDTDQNDDEDDEQAAIIADYIANMRADSREVDGEEDAHPGLGVHPFNILRDLGGTDSEVIPSQPSSDAELDDALAHDEDENDTLLDERSFPSLELEDERLARLLAKQEELGLDADEVILLDGVISDGGEWFPSSMHINPRKKKGASKRSRMFQQGSQFPSATKMAEAFDELELMDLQDAHMRRPKKGHLSLDFSDSELEDALNVAVKKDRLKKADKKKAREELRVQGLLGKDVKPDDPRVKYRGGMSLDDVANEFEAFLLGTQEQLSLPPLDKAARQIIHSIANQLKIKTKSAGKGTARYPVLYRSKATWPFDANRFEVVFGRVQRMWFGRVDADEKVVRETRILKRTEAPVRKTRTSKQSLTLREGDVVGKHAAEIGIENRGRTMLEKMGWSKGMSLGTGENKGITVPLMHVVKKTKAGLGDV
ncbi:hypothetical protein GGR57DRAFT_503072 [Xylariaceae sp. FL1272]|nr:hypothetical protein GGR57DRAFT_503072 [Xylariaceae sp. FL1272]